ncbi:MAG: GNAT family N-acetyltransferase [Planctomycetota bacterium]|nr:GNAT family N-acetyltransferase [Planctomycetota bacterium]
MLALVEDTASRMHATDLRVTDLTTVAETQPELVSQWRELVECSPEAAIELHPDLVLEPAATGQRRSRGLLVHASSEESGLAQLAVLQEKLVRLPFLRGIPGRLPLRGLRLVGNQVLGADDASTARTVIARFEALLAAPAGAPDCILFEDLELDSALCRAAEQTSQARALWLAAPQTRWALRFPAEAPAYWNQFSSKTRYNFRRTQRQLEHTWSAIREPAQVAAFLAESASISQQSWQAKRLGVRVQSDDLQVRQFTHLAELGALRCYLLRSQDTPVAFAIGTQWNGRFRLEEIGYDAAYAKFSPGTVLLLRMLEDMLACDAPEWLDFGFGDGDYKRLFGNHQTSSGTLLLVSRRLWPTLATGLNRTGTWLEQTARAGLRRGGWAGWLRKIYRH